MTPKQYQEESARTAADKDIHRGLPKYPSNNLMHAAIGIATEAGELLDAVKKALFYGKPLDLPNIYEELGDIEWYMAMARRELMIDQEVIQEMNISKLRARFPDKFDEDKAINRDLDKERQVLEGTRKT